MRLQREPNDEVVEESSEYRCAVKSVIRCQIQSLLQKLASETGEESIVISTNVSTGTYNHLGSYLGQEYLVEDGDDHIHGLCQKFNNFCAALQGQSALVDPTQNTFNRIGELLSKKGKSTLPRPKATPRKRPLNVSHLAQSPPSKKHQVENCSSESGLVSNFSKSFFKNPEKKDENFITSPAKGKHSSPTSVNESSQLIDKNGNPTSQLEKEKMDAGIVPYIKIEPTDDYGETNSNGEDSVDGCFDPDDDNVSPNSIINRPKSLIPLANIFKRYGSNKNIKKENQISPSSEPGQATSVLRALYESQPIYNMTDLESDAALKDGTNQRSDDPDSLPSEKSILKSLYESQPIYDPGEFHPKSDISPKGGSSIALNLPTHLNTDVEQFPPSSENLVLSGFYDSDSYPTYRKTNKQLGNSHANSKKSKANKGGNSISSNPETPNTSQHEVHLRTFESGGRLVYACDVCKRELSHLTSYRRHMKLHTMERPHKCPVCDKGFIRKYHCIDHLNKHHKGIGFDADTLTLTGQNTEIPALDQSAMSDSPGEYTYILDQSLGGISEADQSQSMINNIDQSASTMLSVLAKSAADDINFNQSADSSQIENSQSKEGNFEINQSETRSVDIQSDETSSEANSENSATARKLEVNEGIKAIVAHLKSKNRRKNVYHELDISPQVLQINSDDA